PNGMFEFLSAFSVGHDSFTYVISDGALESTPALVNLLITGVNDAPVAHTDSYTTNEDTTLTVTAALGVLANDSDIDASDSLSVTLPPLSAPAHGAVSLGQDGCFVYTPDPNYHGPDAFTYRVIDGHGALSNVATVNLTVNSVNDAPFCVVQTF